jgi:hypothetical protein
MAHANIRYNNIWVGNKGACLNYNLLGACANKSCTYRHLKAKASEDWVLSVAGKLKPAMDSFMAARAPTGPGRKRKHGT